MSSQTAKYAIPYATAPDVISSLPTTMANMAARLDLLAGESGSVSLTVAANTDATVAITFSRTYPGNAGGTPGMFLPTLLSSLAGGRFDWWIAGYTGTSSTLTGVSLGYRFSVAVTARPVLWHFHPVL
jgi:hypothetical protein